MVYIPVLCDLDGSVGKLKLAFTPLAVQVVYHFRYTKYYVRYFRYLFLNWILMRWGGGVGGSGAVRWEHLVMMSFGM